MNKLTLFLTLTLLLALLACTKDLVVQDIKDASVTILAPANNTKTPTNAVTFWWELIDGAEKYNIQIVKPSFAAVQTLVVDTNVSGNKFTRSLSPGLYQWRVKAYNAGGSTAYTQYNLTIDTTSNLGNVLVVPVSPANGFLTAQKTITLSWTQIPVATSYQLQVLNSTGAILKDTTTAATSYVYSAVTTTGSAYSWKVKAFNNTSVSQFNTAQTFTIDLKPPFPPTLSSPANLSTATGTVDLKWTRNTSTLADVRYDSIYVATDSTFPAFAIVVSARVNGTQINTAAFSPSLAPNATATEKYFWRVRSVDSVQNASTFSAWWKFHLNP